MSLSIDYRLQVEMISYVMQDHSNKHRPNSLSPHAK